MKKEHADIVGIIKSTGLSFVDKGRSQEAKKFLAVRPKTAMKTKSVFAAVEPAPKN